MRVPVAPQGAFSRHMAERPGSILHAFGLHGLPGTPRTPSGSGLLYNKYRLKNIYNKLNINNLNKFKRVSVSFNENKPKGVMLQVYLNKKAFFE